MIAESPWLNERSRRREKARATIAQILGSSREKINDSARLADVIGSHNHDDLHLGLVVNGFVNKAGGAPALEDIRRETVGDILDQIR